MCEFLRLICIYIAIVYNVQVGVMEAGEEVTAGARAVAIECYDEQRIDL